ncbi:metallophosphoesterase family protein [Oceanirhabdus sp. W0125-5]|uniref:metallophosphoesterase family protein n=1 Tax=Oceanirhabdus sp. W0125-5 TaxID=2999116 RepID=UPI0022F2C088|nr:metallophosphoesterase [Oceanirhabdus sp. W0125-5]WBW98827.1 metallophosphoesterase [Oceanirhabdus sp. W0125-5]
MKIAVLSDTHGNRTMMKCAVEKILHCDVVIHLGDNDRDVEYLKKYINVPFYVVKGNCDFGSKEPSELFQHIGGKKVLMTHGHKYNVKYSLMSLMYRGLENEVDIILFGHTHVPVKVYNQNVLIMNPGSVGNPRMGPATIGIIEIIDDVIYPSIVEI